MKIAFFVTNHYQLITAIHMKMTLFSEDDLHIYTTVAEIKDKLDILKKIAINHVFYLQDDNNSFFYNTHSEANRLCGILGADSYFIENYGFDIQKDIMIYDLILTAGYPIASFCLFTWCKKINDKVEIWRVGDGTIFHFYPLDYLFYREIIPLMIDSDLCFSTLWSECDYMTGYSGEYLYHLEMTAPRSNLKIEIPKIDRNGIEKMVINSLLPVNMKNLSMEEGNIYFFDTGGIFNGEKRFLNEKELLEFVCCIVNEKKVIVRCHPTTNRDFYVNTRAYVDRGTASIEYNYMNSDLENKTLICLSTTAVHTPFELFNIHPRKVIFLHNLAKENEKYPALKLFDNIVNQFLINLINYYVTKFPDIYCIVNSFEEAKQIMEEIK